MPPTVVSRNVFCLSRVRVYICLSGHNLPISFPVTAPIRLEPPFFFLLVLLFRTALAPRGCMCACVLPLFVCIVTICIGIFRG